MENSMAGKFFSADGHVIEPADLWITRLDACWRDRAPHFERHEKGDYTVVDGMAPMPMGLEGTVINDKIAGEIRSAARKPAPTRVPAHRTRMLAWPIRISIMFAAR